MGAGGFCNRHHCVQEVLIHLSVDVLDTCTELVVDSIAHLQLEEEQPPSMNMSESAPSVVP